MGLLAWWRRRSLAPLISVPPPAPVLVPKERIMLIDRWQEYRGIPIYWYEDVDGPHVWPRPMGAE